MNFSLTLPKKYMSAGAIFLNEEGRILLVNPTYKPPWEIPGGITEANESPLQCCIREVQEELGLTVVLERMLSVSYTPSRNGRLESVQFIFWGGVLDAETIAQIRLPSDELSEFGFFGMDEVLQRLSVTNAERVRRSLEVVDTERTLYLEL